MNKRKRLLLLLGTVLLAVVLVGCGTSPITEQSTGIWDKYVIFNFSRVIIWLSNLFGGSYGVGIIVFTLIIRLILLQITGLYILWGLFCLAVVCCLLYRLKMSSWKRIKTVKQLKAGFIFSNS